MPLQEMYYIAEMIVGLAVIISNCSTMEDEMLLQDQIITCRNGGRRG